MGRTMKPNFEVLKVLSEIYMAVTHGHKTSGHYGGFTRNRKNDVIVIDTLRSLGFEVTCLNPEKDSKDYVVSLES